MSHLRRPRGHRGGPNFHHRPDIPKFDECLAVADRAARAARAARAVHAACGATKKETVRKKGQKATPPSAEEEQRRKVAEDHAATALAAAVSKKRRELRNALTFSPHDGRVHARLAMSFATEKRKNNSDAMHHAKKALLIDPTNALAYCAQGHALSSSTDSLEAAIRAFDNFLVYGVSGRSATAARRAEVCGELRRKRRDFEAKKVADKTPDQMVERLDDRLNRTRLKLLLSDAKELLSGDDLPASPPRHIHRPSMGLLPVASSMSRHVFLPDGARPRTGYLAKHGGLCGYYQKGGQYESDCRQIMISARRYIQRMLLRWDLKARENVDSIKVASTAATALLGDGKPGKNKRRKKKKRLGRRATLQPRMDFIAIDVDDTLISSFPFMEKYGFNQDAPVVPQFDARYLGMEPEDVTPIAPVLEFAQWVYATPGINVVFFTARPTWCRDVLLESLKKLAWWIRSWRLGFASRSTEPTPHYRQRTEFD